MLFNSFARAAQHISGAGEAINFQKTLKSLILLFISTAQLHSLLPDRGGFHGKINQAYGAPALQWKPAACLVYGARMLL